jgi:hypothetical protein
LARYRKSTNIPSFVKGDEHWALTDQGLLYWRGRALDPPENAQVIANGADLTAPTPETAQRQLTPAAPPVSADIIQLPADAGPPIMPEAPGWVQLPLALLREYDRRNGTVLVPAIVRAGISTGNIGGVGGAWGLFVPSSHRIILDAALADEAPQAIAPVLGHEADHARDTFQYGPPRTEQACYTFEITAFALQARIWASMYGPNGKPDPSTDLETELNLILSTSRTSADTLIGALKRNYQSECG